MQFTIGVEEITTILNTGPQYLSHYLFYTKKCNELNVGGGILSFLDEGVDILKIKVLR
jgi:hypothetical protein